MKPELYVAIMNNSLYEMLCVSFLGYYLTDAEDKAKRYAEQLNGTIVGAYHAPDVHDIQIITGKGRPKEGN